MNESEDQSASMFDDVRRWHALNLEVNRLRYEAARQEKLMAAVGRRIAARIAGTAGKGRLAVSVNGMLGESVLALTADGNIERLWVVSARDARFDDHEKETGDE